MNTSYHALNKFQAISTQSTKKAKLQYEKQNKNRKKTGCIYDLYIRKNYLGHKDHKPLKKSMNMII